MHIGLLSKYTIVRSFFRAAKATFASKAAVWFRPARLFIFAPDSQAKHACRQAEIPLSDLFKIPEPPHLSCFGGGGKIMKRREIEALSEGCLPEAYRDYRPTNPNFNAT